MDGKLWKENEKKFFLSIFGWVERKKINGMAKCFFPGPTKKFTLKQRKNWKEKLCIIFWRKYPCVINSSALLLFIPFFFSTPRCSLLFERCLAFFFFFCFTGRRCQPLLILFFFFLLIYWAGLSSILFLFFCFLFCFLGLDVIFFYGHDFYFLINLGDWFFWLFIIFLILIGHHF